MKRWLVVLLVLFIMPAFLFTVSCQKKVAAQANKPVATVVPAKPASPPSAPTFSGAPDFLNEKIYFEFDKSVLTKESQDNLTKKTAWLKANPTVKVMIEGNCDERGTAEYNMALGERRALAAKKFLVDSGVKTENLKAISYGEEKPVCKEKTEACWAKNRNDAFVVFK